MNIELIKYGYFWVPGNEFEEFVLSWKQKVEAVEPDAVYLHHPIHATLFLFYGEKQKEQDNWEKLTRVERLGEMLVRIHALKLSQLTQPLAALCLCFDCF